MNTSPYAELPFHAPRVSAPAYFWPPIVQVNGNVNGNVVGAALCRHSPPRGGSPARGNSFTHKVPLSPYLEAIMHELSFGEQLDEDASGPGRVVALAGAAAAGPAAAERSPRAPDEEDDDSSYHETPVKNKAGKDKKKVRADDAERQTTNWTAEIMLRFATAYLSLPRLSAKGAVQLLNTTGDSKGKLVLSEATASAYLTIMRKAAVAARRKYEEFESKMSGAKTVTEKEKMVVAGCRSMQLQEVNQVIAQAGFEIAGQHAMVQVLLALGAKLEHAEDESMRKKAQEANRKQIIADMSAAGLRGDAVGAAKAEAELKDADERAKEENQPKKKTEGKHRKRTGEHGKAAKRSKKSTDESDEIQSVGDTSDEDAPKDPYKENRDKYKHEQATRRTATAPSASATNARLRDKFEAISKQAEEAAVARKAEEDKRESERKQEMQSVLSVLAQQQQQQQQLQQQMQAFMQHFAPQQQYHQHAPQHQHSAFGAPQL